MVCWKGHGRRASYSPLIMVRKKKRYYFLPEPSPSMYSHNTFKRASQNYKCSSSDSSSRSYDGEYVWKNLEVHVSRKREEARIRKTLFSLISVQNSLLHQQVLIQAVAEWLLHSLSRPLDKD